MRLTGLDVPPVASDSFVVVVEGRDDVVDVAASDPADPRRWPVTRRRLEDFLACGVASGSTQSSSLSIRVEVGAVDWVARTSSSTSWLAVWRDCRSSMSARKLGGRLRLRLDAKEEATALSCGVDSRFTGGGGGGGCRRRAQFGSDSPSAVDSQSTAASQSTHRCRRAACDGMKWSDVSFS